ncbi:MAG: Lpg1974 family pore-forming outer membrane protein [Gemmataceae bacterium]
MPGTVWRRLLGLLLVAMSGPALYAQTTSSFQPAAPPAPLVQPPSTPIPPPPVPPGGVLRAGGVEAPPPPATPGVTYPLPSAPVWNYQPYCPPPAAPACPVYPNACPPVAPVGRQVPTTATEGPFASAEFMMSQPVLQVTTNQFPVLAAAPPNAVPAADLGLFLSPTFELGYRFATRGDFIVASYRFLTTDGNDPQTIGGVGPFPIHTELHLNQWDLDYGTVYSDGPKALWSFTTRLGLRATNLYYASSVQAGADTYGIRNSFWGGGPHGRFEVERKFAFFPDLSLYGRADGALVLGQTTRTATHSGPGGEVSNSQSLGQGIPMLNVQAGLSYSPEEIPGFAITGGYVYEHYWSIGTLSTSEGRSFFNNGELFSHGWFIRGQLDF